MSDPFAPPADRGADPIGRVAGALSAWALCGAVCGTAVGYTLHATRELVGMSGPFGLGGVVAGLGAGLVAVRMERGWARHLSALPGQRATAWPVHGALVATPLVILMPAALWLGLVASVGSASLLPVVAAGLAVLGLSWSLVRVWSDHRLVEGLLALSRGEPDAARLALGTLAQHPLATGRARRAARENLGALLLQEGELDAAAHWYAQVEGSARAAAGLAVVQAAMGRADAAQATVERGRACPDARHARSELDAARVFALWQAEGEQAARELADRLDGPEAGALFSAVRDRLHGAEVAEGSLLAALLGARAARERAPRS